MNRIKEICWGKIFHSCFDAIGWSEGRVTSSWKTSSISSLLGYWPNLDSWNNSGLPLIVVWFRKICVNMHLVQITWVACMSWLNEFNTFVRIIFYIFTVWSQSQHYATIAARSNDQPIKYVECQYFGNVGAYLAEKCWNVTIEIPQTTKSDKFVSKMTVFGLFRIYLVWMLVMWSPSNAIPLTK